MQVIKDWFKRNLSDPQVVILTAFLVVGTLVIMYMGRILAPVLASVVIAYLLEGIVRALERRHVPRLPAVLAVFSVFMAFLLVLLIGMLPMLSRQVVNLAVSELPDMISIARKQLEQLPEQYPEFVSKEQVDGVVSFLQQEQRQWAARALTITVASLRGVGMVLVYLILMPLLVFFFLKDKKIISAWFAGLLPEDRRLTTEVWRDVDRQIGNYIRGKFLEILIVWACTSATLYFLDLEFAMLLGFFVGLSVLIPYIGATLMTIPVALMGYFQFGLTAPFVYVVIAYLIIQLLDGNLLAPLLLSGVVNLHPVAVIVAVLVFGGLWGFWGVFFAIPLATLIQAVLRAWPRKSRKTAATSPDSTTLGEPESG